MNVVQFALRLLRRDWRSGEIRLLSLALIVAAASVTAVGFFTNRVERAIELQAAEMLAADLVVGSSYPTPNSFLDKAAELNLSSTSTQSFPSVVFTDDRTQLVNVKAVAENYPLRGELRTRNQLSAPENRAEGIPSSGTLWAESRLLSNLQLSVGDSLSLGERSFEIARVLSRDSGGGGNLFRLGPRVLVNMTDIPSTGLVTEASRVRYSLLLAGQPEALKTFRNWVETNHPSGIRFEDISNARPELRTALDRGSSFLGLAALVAVLVAGAAVALATHRFVQKQSDVSAIMRCLGANSRFIFRVLLIRLLIIALIASAIGSVLGYLAQFLLVELIGDWFTHDLPSPDLYPLLTGIGTGLITLLGFTLTPMLRLSAVPPLRVLRRDLNAPPASFWAMGIGALLALSLLMTWQAGNITLAGIVLGGTLTAVSLMLLVSFGLIKSLAPLRQHAGSTWRYGLAGLARNPNMTAIQLTGFGIGLLALLLLAIVRVDLLNAWEQTIPADTPNHFLINIQPHEVEALSRHLADQDLDNGGLYPMLRARLTRINDTEVIPENYPDGRPRRLVSRAFNLSWAAEIQDHNTLVQGNWWTQQEKLDSLFSVEEGIAETLGITVGDELQYNLAGVPVSGTVANLRQVEWDSFQPNFFVIGTPGMLQDYPSTYITSFYLASGEEHKLSQLIQQFPSVTMIDVSSLMNQVREIIARGTMAVEYVFLFTLIAGLLVLYAGIQASRESRRQESAILRTLGVKRNRLLKSVAVEFITLGLLAGTLASLCATVTGWGISTALFELDYTLNPWIWIIGTLGGALGIGVAGILATYPLVVHPPLHTLRAE